MHAEERRRTDRRAALGSRNLLRSDENVVLHMPRQTILARPVDQIVDRRIRREFGILRMEAAHVVDQNANFAKAPQM